MEILAPVGSVEALKLAVANGADAVYLGLDRFSARKKADAFTLQNLKKWVDCAHFFGVKVYLTVNTLVSDSELLSAAEMVAAAANCCIDAFLVQDIGLLKLLHSSMPDIALHCSTQMGIHNIFGAEFAERSGARRVVLSREATIEDIRQIKQNTRLEVEVFAHGALCVGFSGNCYYSSLVSGCSGNRGNCLQLCRKRYGAELDKKEERAGYLLSPADLCLVDRVQDLADAGVDSLKIEGRLKRPEYAGITARIYKNAANGITSSRKDMYALKSIYNRGNFTQGYAFSTTADNGIIYPKAQGHIGAPTGAVVKIEDGEHLLMETVLPQDVRDGYKIFRDGVEIANCTGCTPVSGGSEKKYLYRACYSGRPTLGADVRITTDTRVCEAVSAQKRSLPMSYLFSLKVGQVASVTAQSGDFTCRRVSDYTVQTSKTAPTTYQEIAENAAKLGDTDFSMSACGVDGDDDIFVPKSVISALRRAAIDDLQQIILTDYEEKNKLSVDSYVSNNTLYSTMSDIIKGKHVQQSSFSAVKKERNAFAFDDLETGKAIHELQKFDFSVYNPRDYSGLSPAPRWSVPVYLALPMIANARDLQCLMSQAQTIKTYRGIVAQNVYALPLAGELALPVIAGARLNISNRTSGIQFEEVISAVEFEPNEGAFVYGYGAFPLMTLSHCPYCVSAEGADCAYCPAALKTLTYTDDRGKKLSVRRVKISRCYFELTDVLELPAKRRKATNTMFDFSGVDANEACKVLQAYQRGEEILSEPNYFRPFR